MSRKVAIGLACLASATLCRATSALPPTDGGVFQVNASSVIYSTEDKVWSVLLDFPNYGKWNTFVRKQVIKDGLVPAPDQTPYVGANLLLEVHLPPSCDKCATPSTERITVLNKTNYTLAWIYTGAPENVMRSERFQVLSRQEDGGVLYETREVFYGPLAYVTKSLEYKKLVQGFQAVANDLKKRVENTANS